MSDGPDLAMRARCLATEQWPDGEVASALVVEFGLSLQAAREHVAAMADDLVTARLYGRGLVRSRIAQLAKGEDLGKVTGAHLSAMDTFGHAYLGLGEREQTAKLIEQAERKLAKGTGKGLRVA